MDTKKIFIIMGLFTCQLSLAENIEYIELAIQKSQVETVQKLLKTCRLSQSDKKQLLMKARLQTTIRKTCLYNSNSSSKGFKRTLCGYALAVAGFIYAINGKGQAAVTSLALGITLSEWGNHAKTKDFTHKIISKAKKYEDALSIEKLLKKEISQDSDKKE
jgi:hypothetical protein